MPAASLLIAALLLQPAPGAGSVRVQVIHATTGVSVPDASIELPDLDRRVLTDRAGAAALNDVPPGPHHLQIRRVGFVPHRLHVFVGERHALQLTVVLTPLPTRIAGLRVEAPPLIEMPGRDPGSSPHQRAVTDQQLRQHPLLPEPDLLLGLTGGHATTRPEAPGGVNLLGGLPDHVAYRVDGIPVRSPYHGGGTFAALSPDAIAESMIDASPGALPADDALGGSIRWATRPVLPGWRWLGGMSTTQSRLLVEGGSGRVGFLVAGRSVFPGLVWHKGESAHLAGEASDGISRAIVPLAGGTLRAIALASRSEASFASRVPEDTAAHPAPRHEFSWRTAAAGMQWARTVGATAVGVTAWQNEVGATASWYPDSGGLAILDSHLRDRGAEVSVVRTAAAGTWSLAAQHRRLTSEYRATQREDAATATFAPVTRRWVSFVQPQWKRTGRAAEFVLGSVLWGPSTLRIAPFAEVAWRRSTIWRLSLGATRRLQHTQSFRNGEAIGALVFVADAPVVAGDRSAPVARSDQLLAAASWTPSAARHVTWRAWARRLHGLSLPAVGNPYPFAVRSPVRGQGRALGTSIDAAYTATRFAVMGSYGFHDVTLTAADTTWQPEFSVTHVLDAGAIAYLTPRISIRINGTAGAGRRATGFTGAFEWESCNLRDRGCEFAGAPGRTPGALGGVALPSWMRWDLAARAHGHVPLGGRDLQVDLFASWSNLFNRRNVLTRVRNNTSNGIQDVVMRPSSPLVIGLDWRM